MHKSESCHDRKAQYPIQSFPSMDPRDSMTVDPKSTVGAVGIAREFLLCVSRTPTSPRYSVGPADT